MAKSKNKHEKQPSSCPQGWHPAGHVTPIRLTVKQQLYCRRAVGIARFVHNLCVATHRFHRANRMRWPSWQDLSKAFNECKHEDYPFVQQVLLPRRRGRLPRLRRHDRQMARPVCLCMITAYSAIIITAVYSWTHPWKLP